MGLALGLRRDADGRVLERRREELGQRDRKLAELNVVFRLGGVRVGKVAVREEVKGERADRGRHGGLRSGAPCLSYAGE